MSHSECLSGNYFPRPAKSEAPLLLGRVCSYWRSVALSTHGLWTGISLGKRYPDHPEDLAGDANAAMQWRINAGPRAVQSYNLAHHYWGGDEDSLVDLMNIIIPQHQLWRRIQGLLPLPIAKQILSAIPDASVLEYLNIATRNAYHPLDINVHTMHRLQKLVLRMDEPVIQFGACRSQSLREVIIDQVCTAITLDVCWLFIAQCPNLEVFQADCYATDAFTFHHLEILRHAHLTYLHLRAMWAEPGPFIDEIEAPYLKFMTLQYHTIPVMDGWGWPHLTSFLNRSECQLTHFDFGCHPDVRSRHIELLACYTWVEVPLRGKIFSHDKSHNHKPQVGLREIWRGYFMYQT
ncbi:hypothetical protein BD410DRAFT_541805 [Rickenella mellea]|uniref:F-box domain-containing protein n=1 Tax=Rickenella mellea TaxID=50990 RepID=A0A4Y7PQC4_9AGAM|nr:hypothetical protein BD410DRAFT_541805 [Rickenella mellea]